MMDHQDRQEITGEIEKVRSENKRDVYRWLILIVTAVLGPCLAIWISTENQHKSEQRQCRQIAANLRVYNENFKTLSVAGLAQRQASIDLFREFHCPQLEPEAPPS